MPFSQSSVARWRRYCPVSVGVGCLLLGAYCGSGILILVSRPAHAFALRSRRSTSSTRPSTTRMAASSSSQHRQMDPFLIRTATASTTAGSQQHATPTRSSSRRRRRSSDDRIENKAITTRIIRRWWPQTASPSEARHDPQQRNLDPFLIRPTTVATLPTRTQTAPLASPTITATRRTTPVLATGTATSTATRTIRPITTIVCRRRRYGRRSRRLGRRTNGIIATRTTLQ